MDDDPEDFYNNEPEPERPVKKVRFLEPQPNRSPPSDAGYDDTEDFYTTSEQPGTEPGTQPSTVPSTQPPPSNAKAVTASDHVATESSIPGLGTSYLPALAIRKGEQLIDKPAQPEDKNDKDDDSRSSSSSQEMYGNKVKTIDSHTSAQESTGGNVSSDASKGGSRRTTAMTEEDEEAEWRFDTSDEDPTSDDNSDDSDDDDDEDGEEEEEEERVSGFVSSRNVEDEDGTNVGFDDSESSDSSEDSESSYKPLSLEEQTAILMRGDPEIDGSSVTGHGAPTTIHEIAQKPVRIPAVVVTPDMKTPELGEGKFVIDNLLLVKATLSANTRVLESGSVVCLKDKTVIGAIQDTLGRVEEPHYLVAFPNEKAIHQHNIRPGIKIFYVEKHSTFALTHSLKMKGSDASNLYDEEVADGQRAFSDDEAEAKFKRERRRKRQANKANQGRSSVTHQPSKAGLPHAGRVQAPENMARNSTQSYPYPYPFPSQPSDFPASMLPYGGASADLDDDDDLYTPLARPDNLVNSNLGDQHRPSSRHTSAQNKRKRDQGSGSGSYSQDSRGVRNDRRRRVHWSPSDVGANGGGDEDDEGNDRRTPSDEWMEHEPSTSLPQRTASAHRYIHNPMPNSRSTYPRPTFSSLAPSYQDSSWQYSSSVPGTSATYQTSASPPGQADNHSGAPSETFTYGTYLNPAFFGAAQYNMPVQQLPGSNWAPGTFAPGSSAPSTFAPGTFAPGTFAHPTSAAWEPPRMPVSYDNQPLPPAPPPPPSFNFYGSGHAPQQLLTPSEGYDPRTPQQQYLTQSNEYDPQNPELHHSFRRTSLGEQGGYPTDEYHPTNPWNYSKSDLERIEIERANR